MDLAPALVVLAAGIGSRYGGMKQVAGVGPDGSALMDYAIYDALRAGFAKPLAEHHLERPPDHRYDLPPGTTVVVDDGAMVSTPKLAELVALADRREWHLALVGDPLQFSVEREASVRLRGGDPDVLDLYDDRGRIHGGSRRRMERAVVEAWWASRARGERAAMMAPSTDTVVAVNRRAQSPRAEAGEIDQGGPSVVAGPCRLPVGDVVATPPQRPRCAPTGA